jgi:excisionase family DNA binding protein
MPPVAAPPDQRAQVIALSRAIEGMSSARTKRAPKCKLIGPRGKAVSVPESVFLVLGQVAAAMASGEPITVVPVSKEVTTQQAADLLNVSRQYLVRLLDEGHIPCRRTGKHRRLRVGDVLAYRATRDKGRRSALRKLSKLTQSFGGYDVESK